MSNRPLKGLQAWRAATHSAVSPGYGPDLNRTRNFGLRLGPEGWIRENCGWSSEQLSLGRLVPWTLDDGLGDLERAGLDEEQRHRG